MRLNRHYGTRAMLLGSLIVCLTLLSTRVQADTAFCGQIITVPFTDVAGNIFFCDIAEAYFSGLTNGTTPTTYSPSQNVPREQMAAFITRTMDQSLTRGSKRAALKQFWTPTSVASTALTTVGSGPLFVESDGADLWVVNYGDGTVSRVRASDGKLLGTWTGASVCVTGLAAMGRIFVTGYASPGRLYVIDPTQPAGAVTTLTGSLPPFTKGISFDGARIWTANVGGSVSIVTLNPLSVETVTTGFITPNGILYDGAHIWVTDIGTNPGKLLKLDFNGAIVQTVTVGHDPYFPVFDGTNIWVPNISSNSLTIVRASTSVVLATLTGNGLNGPLTAAFDGERILVTNSVGNNISLWKATDLSPLGSVSTGAGTTPTGACSDGLNFWVTFQGTSKLARF
jgi:hypothetical protein